jgi:hypothetical protein
MEMYNETPCIAILNKQQFFFFKIRGQKGLCLGVGTHEREEDIKKRYRRVNVEILCTHV